MQALSETIRFVLPRDDELTKARTHKYIRRWKGKDGKWQYEYADEGQRKRHEEELGAKEQEKNIKAIAESITERYPDYEAMDFLTSIGDQLYEQQASSQIGSGKYQLDGTGFSLMDMKAWQNAQAIGSFDQRLNRMREILAKYRKQLTSHSIKAFEDYVKLGLWDALRIKQTGDPSRLEPEKTRFGDIALPLAGDRLKGKDWENYRDTMRKYKAHGLKFDGTDRVWFVPAADLPSFPWGEMRRDLEGHGLSMAELPEDLTTAGSPQAQTEEPAKPKGPHIAPQASAVGNISLPLAGPRVPREDWGKYIATMRDYKADGLRFDGGAKEWFVPKKKVADFPWQKMRDDLQSFGMDLAELPHERVSQVDEPSTESPPQALDVDTVVEAIQRRRVDDTVAVTVVKEGKHKGKYAFYSTFSREFNDIFSNKSGVLTGVTEYVPDLGHARVTDNRHLVDEALERIKDRMPDHTVVVAPEVEAKQKEQGEALAEAQKPIPEVTAKLAKGINLFPFQNAGVRFLLETDGNALIGDSMGLGKLQPVKEPVMTPDGWRPIGDLKVGDLVYGVDGKPTTVEGVYPQGVLDIAKVSFTDGSWTRCGWEHLWNVQTPNQKFKHGNKRWLTMTLEEIYNLGLADTSGNRRWHIPMTAPVAHKKKTFPVDPYTLGVMLGDGSIMKTRCQLTTDKEIVDALNLKGTKRPHKTSPQTIEFAIHDEEFKKSIGEDLKLAGCYSHEKFIPSQYFLGSIEQRLALLQGLLDTDGSPMGDGGLEFSSTSEMLIDGVIELVESLGGIARNKTSRFTYYTYAGERRQGKLSWRVNVKLPIQFEPFRLQRKLEKWIPHTKYPPVRLIDAIEPEDAQEAVCIKVSNPDGLFLTRHHIVTHNTSQTLAYAAAKNKRILVVCPKVVRKNWLREATRFFPDYFRGRELKSADLKKTGQPDLSKDNIVTVNYESLEKFRPAIEAAGFDAIVVDESHRMKNPKAKITKTIKAVAENMPHKILLSGTAIKNKKVELFEQLNLIKPGMFSSADELKRATTGGVWHKLKSVYMARQKQDVLKDLPPKISSIVQMEVPRDQLPPTPKDIGEMSAAKQALAIAKTDGTSEYVKEMLTSSDSNILVFTDSKEAAEQLHRKIGNDVAVIHHGSHSDKHREEAVSHFDPATRQAGDKKRVFIATTQSAGIGINLQTADKVVFNDLPWTPADLRQAEDRAHRIGTESSVNVYWQTVEGHEFDQLIAETIKTKYELSKKVLEGKQLTKEERAWMDKAVSPQEMLATLKGERPAGEPATVRADAEKEKQTQSQPTVTVPKKDLPPEVAEGKRAEPPKAVLKPKAEAKGPEPKPEPKPKPKAEPQPKPKAEPKPKFVANLPQAPGPQQAATDHVSSERVPQSLRDAAAALHAQHKAGQEAGQEVPRGTADRLETWMRMNAGETIDGGRVNTVGKRAWTWSTPDHTIKLVRPTDRGPAYLRYSPAGAPEPPPSKPPQTPPAAVPGPEEGATTTVQGKPAPKPKQTARAAPGAHVMTQRRGRRTKTARAEAAGQMRLFKSRRPALRAVVPQDAYGWLMGRVDHLLKSHDLDGALDLLAKAAGHKYLRRIPTGDPKRRWRYVYSEASGQAAGGEPQKGEKLRLTSEGQAGHYEVEHAYDNGWVTLRHDESGAFLTMHRDMLQDLYRQEHAAKIEAAHKRLKKTVSAARQYGSEMQQKRAQGQLMAFQAAWDIKPKADEPKAVIREFGPIERNEMEPKANEIAGYDTPTIEGLLADIESRIKIRETLPAGVPIAYLRWKAVIKQALDLRKDRQATATKEQLEAPPIVAPATVDPETLPPAQAPEGTPKEVKPKQPKQPAKEPESGKLEAVGDHIYGSIKDLRREGLIQNPEALNTMSFRDAARVVKKENVVPTHDPNTLRAVGMSASGAHMALGLLASIKMKPGDTDEQRRAYIRDAAEVSESILNCKTMDDVRELGMEIHRARKAAPRYIRAADTQLYDLPKGQGRAQFEVIKLARAAAKELAKQTPGVDYEVLYVDEEGKTASQYSAVAVGIFKKALRPYDSLGERFDRFIRGDGKEYRSVWRTAHGIQKAEQAGTDGWQLLNAAGDLEEKKKQAKIAERKAKQEGKGQFEEGKTYRGWSEALQVAGKVIREGGTPVPATADAERTRQTFNLREIDYGTEGYMKQADREYHTKALEGALHDLSDVLGVPPHMVSFQGRLGIGLGARGKGTAGGKKKAAKAHYEPGKFAMNITKWRGGGSVAHEWGHALDNLIVETNVTNRTGALDEEFATHIPTNPNLPADVRNAVQGVLQAMTKAENPAQARKQHEKRLAELKGTLDAKRQEFNQLRERKGELDRRPSTEQQRVDRLERAKARLVREQAQLEQYQSQKGKKAEDNARYAQAMVNMTEKSIALYSDPKSVWSDQEREEWSSINREMSVAGQEIDSWHLPIYNIAKSMDPEGSNYAMDAAILGQGYWDMPTEMLARAFAAYTEDKLAEKQRRNTYLVDGTRVLYRTEMSIRPEDPDAQPFPQGRERERIHKAMEALIEVMKKGGHLQKSEGPKRDHRFVLRK